MELVQVGVRKLSNLVPRAELNGEHMFDLAC